MEFMATATRFCGTAAAGEGAAATADEEEEEEGTKVGAVTAGRTEERAGAGRAETGAKEAGEDCTCR